MATGVNQPYGRFWKVEVASVLCRKPKNSLVRKEACAGYRRMQPVPHTRENNTLTCALLL